MSNKTITSPKGFRVSAVAAGIKASGKPDIGLLVADCPCVAAGMFTRNRVVSPAVITCRKHLRGGLAQAVFVNAGNANTATGKRGDRDVESICRYTAEKLGLEPRDILICQTGIIGHVLPMDKVRNGILKAAGELSRSVSAGGDFSRAILTTDLKRKNTYAELTVGGKRVRVAGTAKGSGMIAPNMATMLGFITTDANIERGALRGVLKQAVEQSFNKVSVDSHMSTSDSVLMLASGLAGNRLITAGSKDGGRFGRAVQGICDDLARQIAADGEGSRCMITVRVNGAASAEQARKAVRAIVDSPLVRTAFHGADPNWGRIVSAVGYSGARFDAERLRCRIAGKEVFQKGRPARFSASQVSGCMKAKEWEVAVDLGVGSYSDFCYTCDLSREYVTINADYHT